ncbi:MAG: hypothetical protein KKF44_03120 [Nanoarchaeota archaeon]|nr:hypothetical protein [Nanoarchaeota archaeon]
MPKASVYVKIFSRISGQAKHSPREFQCAYEKINKGLPEKCVNEKFGVKEIIYDHPICVCDKEANKCIFEPCENPPCYYG